MHTGTLDAGTLSDYLAVLDYSPGDRSRAELDTLLSRHVARFPFSSVRPILGLAMPLDPAAILERFLAQRHGGYCYEHNGLLFAVLSALGYDIRPVLGRVVFASHDPFAETPLTHRANLVNLDGELYLCDGGFSHLGPGMTVRLSGPEEQPDERFRVIEARPGDWHFQSKRPGGFQSMYRFASTRACESDIELGHFWSHCHPSAIFTNNVVASKIYPDRVESLRNTMFIREPLTGRGYIEEITDADRLRDVLDAHFGIPVSHAQADVLFDRAVRAATAADSNKTKTLP